MLNNYNFNEELKRFEPTEKQCSYCGVNNIQSLHECYFIPLFIEKDRTNIIIYRSVKYAKVEIGIPRCNSCFIVHDNLRILKIACWLLGIAAFILSIFTFGAKGFFFGVVPAFCIGFFSYQFLKKYVLKNNTILTLKAGAEKNKLVQDFIIEGWSFNEPGA